LAKKVHAFVGEFEMVITTVVAGRELLISCNDALSGSDRSSSREYFDLRKLGKQSN
jgi:hypothetical protein